MRNYSPNSSIVDQVRTVGQLLLHHPTTDVCARNKQNKVVHWADETASCFCYMGAVFAVSSQFNFSRTSLFEACECAIGLSDFDGWDWDNLDVIQRKEVATKLANYRGE